MGVKERRARHHAAIEQLILERAEELLLRSGTDGVSLRAVAERIEYSPAAIYGYFSTKDHLLAALAAHGFRQLNGGLTRASEASDSWRGGDQIAIAPAGRYGSRSTRG